MVLSKPISGLLLISGLIGGSVLSQAAEARTRGGSSIPRFAAAAKNIGPEDASKTIDVSIWLKPHNEEEMDALAKDLYNPKSPNYRMWLDRGQFAARFAPSEAEAKTVQQFFTSHGLKVVNVGTNNFFVRARGTVSAVNSAFHVQMQKFEVGGKVYRGNTSEPMMEGPAASLTKSVYGLTDLDYKHPVLTKASLMKQAPSSNRMKSNASGGGPTPPPFFDSVCFGGKKTQTYTGGGVTSSYTGATYTDSALGCGYTPKEIREAYGLDSLYKEGFDGTGQTIVIVDWCGSPTIRGDANAFSTRFGLPALTAANFKITPTPSSEPTPSCASPDAEINLDVEWAHAIAPGAKINLVVPPSPSFLDVDEAVFYAVNFGLGNVISNSYGSEEYYTPSDILATEDLINEIAAIEGISSNYSSGDDGDFTFDFPQYNPISVSAPADSPYATAVGGVSLALDATNKIKWQTGWGNNETLVVDQFPVDPPANFGFVFGSGGGSSAFFNKPSYQKKVKGVGRQIPDISWLADPFTGAVIAISEPFVYPTLQYEAIGGTSLACPMFSALWAIANQRAGLPAGMGLGQAAPYLYSMPAATITDVLPFTSPNNVTGKITDPMGTTLYSAADLAAPLVGTTKFFSTVWNYPLNDNFAFVLTFGTDSSLTTTAGWDNVTGLGVPNPKAFVDYFKP